ETIRKRLTMFVLRSKVRIANESGAFVVLGLIGAAAAEALAALQLQAPAPMQTAARALRSEASSGAGDEPSAPLLTAIGLSPLPAGALAAHAPLPRWLLVVPVDAVDEVWTALRGTLAPIDSACWRWTDVRSGIASIVPA